MMGVMTTGQFIARYPGECANCGATINVGDPVGKVMMQYRRIMNYVAEDPYKRICCAPCHADAAVNGDPSLRW